MLFRKFESKLEKFLLDEPDKILLVNGARQVGKTYLIRRVCNHLFRNYVEVNLKEDKEGKGIFTVVRSTDDFYIQIGAIAGDRLGSRADTIIFLDEIQSYPHILTMLKFLNQEGRFRYVASGSQLGIALAETPSVPIGSISVMEMFPLDFEEFLIAMNCSRDTVDSIRKKFLEGESLNESLHNYMLRQFKLYLLVGGLPEAVNKFIENRNMTQVRLIQKDIRELYRTDASQYDREKKLVIRKLYDMIPSSMENRKKRVVVKKIEGRAGHRQFSDYDDEFEYLTNSGIALAVQAVSNPKFPLAEFESKNLLKLYLNDAGLLTGILFDLNINAVLLDENGVNLGSVYESVVAQELHAHGFKLRYYDNKQKGEVDFIVDDYSRLSVLPIEVKSGKDYMVHCALDNFLKTPEYGISRAVVFSNEKNVKKVGGIEYQPIYYCMFYDNEPGEGGDCIVPLCESDAIDER